MTSTIQYCTVVFIFLCNSNHTMDFQIVLVHIIMSFMMICEYVFDSFVLMLTQEQYGHVSTMTQQDTV